MKREGPSIAFSLSPDPDLDNRSQLSGSLCLVLCMFHHMPRHTVQNSSLSRLSMVAHRRFRAKWAWGRGPWPAREKRRLLLCRHLPVQSRAVEYHCLSVGVRANINFYFFYPAPMQKGRRKRKLNMISLLKIDLWLVRTVLAAFAAFFFP